MNERLTATVGARIAEFRRKMAEVNTIAKKTAKDIVIDVKVNHQKAMRSFGRMAQSMRTLREITGGMAIGSLLMLSPALAPAIASVAGALGGLASSLTAVGGGLGVFGVAAIGNATKLAGKMTDIKSINDKITKERQTLDPNQEKINALLHEREHVLKTMSKAQKGAMKQVNKFSDAWGKFLKQTEGATFQVFADGLKVATSLLHEIKPIVQPVADALSNLLNRFNNFSKTEQFRSFIDFFANRGSSAIKNWGTIAGNILNGFMELMKAFGPLGKDMENGLISMTKKFAKWAAGLSESKAFKSFIDYVKKNGPLLLKTFGNLGKLLINFGIAIAPLGEKVLQLVNAFLKWASEGLKNNKWIGMLIGFIPILLGAFKILWPIILFGVSVFRGIWKVIKTVFPILKKLWLQIGTKVFLAFQKFWGVLAKVLPWIVRIGGILKWLTGPVGIVINIIILLAVIVWKNWDKIWKWTKKIFGAVWTFLKFIWFKTKRFLIDTFIGIFKAAVKKFRDIKKAVSDKMSAVLDKVKDIGSSIMDFFGGIDLKESGKKIIQSAINGIKSMAGKVKKTVSGIAQNIRDFFPFSPPKEGPLTDMHKMDFGWAVTKSISDSKAGIQRAMDSMLTVPNMAVDGFGMNVGAPDNYSSREETHVNMAGVFEGAELTIREEADIDRLARALGERVKDNKRARGIR